MSRESPMLIMAEVDDANLTLSEFRVLGHICRRAGKSDNGRACDASTQAIADSCGIHVDTVQKAIKSLVDLGWLRQQFRTGQTTILTPQFGTTKASNPPEKNTPPAKTTPPNISPPTPPNETGETPPKNSPPKGTHKGTHKGRPETTEDAIRFAAWFRTTLPARIQASLPATAESKWAACYDDMIRLDGRTKREIFDVCKWARTDTFWEKNFRSPLKLRERDKQHVHYFDVFALERERKPGQKPQATAGAADLFAGTENGFQPLFPGHRPDK